MYAERELIKEINIDNRAEWNAIVRSFIDYDVYYLAEYVEAFELHGDGIPTLFYFSRDDLRVMNVVMKRDISQCEYFANVIERDRIFDLSTPYGYGGFLFEGKLSNDSLNQFLSDYKIFCRERGYVSEFIRFHPVLRNADVLKECSEHMRVIDLGNTVTIPLVSFTEIWQSYKANNRNKVRKAIKNGVRAYWGRNRDIFRQFVDLYQTTMDKDNADDYYYFDQDFYLSILDSLKYNSLIFYAVYDEKMIAASIILFANGKMHYHLSGSDPNYSSLAGTNLLLTEAIKWGSENNFKSFHMGGGVGSSSDDSLYTFKQSFNRESDTFFSVGQIIFNEEIYDRLVALRETQNGFVKDNLYFPAYRQKT